MNEDDSIISKLTYKNIRHATKFTIRLDHSKTDTNRQSVTIRLTHFEPVSALIKYCHHQPFPLRDDDYAFTDNNNKIITSSNIIHQLKHRLNMIGYDSTLYSGHSFRKGCATAMASAGISDSIIQHCICS